MLGNSLIILRKTFKDFDKNLYLKSKRIILIIVMFSPLSYVVAQDAMNEVSVETLPDPIVETIRAEYPNSTISQAHGNDNDQYKLELYLEDGEVTEVYLDAEGNRLDDDLDRQLSEISKINDLVENRSKVLFADTFEEGSLDAYQKNTNTFEESFDSWKDSYVEAQKKMGYEFDAADQYFYIPSPDNEPKKDTHSVKITSNKIDNPIITSTQDKITLIFGETSDRKNADQAVSTQLISGLKEVLSLANNFLVDSGVRVIESIYIKATTNGHHSPTSNHSKGEALDISRINGIKIIQTRKSQALQLIFEDAIKKIKLNGNFGSSQKVRLGDVEYVADEILLFDRVKELQRAIQTLNYRRENFGPILKTKFSKESNINSLFYDISNHEDHIHFSVR